MRPRCVHSTSLEGYLFEDMQNKPAFGILTSILLYQYCLISEEELWWPEDTPKVHIRSGPWTFLMFCVQAWPAFCFSFHPNHQIKYCCFKKQNVKIKIKKTGNWLMLKLKVSGLLNFLEKVPPYGKQDEQVCGPPPPVGDRGPVISYKL